ncbi:tyrosine-type recombinase/integrase [Bradyrhizobium sp. S3.2.12]|uniref:tyrosine-type recombinase/integrase n=1 Tax=Bradyrhizobium sp. S3.2.12 TaxID=3156387 RepID=UPI003395400D
MKGDRHPNTYYGIGSNKRKWKKAGVDARIHDLRHTTGMRTLRKTGNLRVVQKILGHTDIAITAKFYTDATVEDMRAAMEATAPRTVEQIPPKAIEKKGD